MFTIPCNLVSCGCLQAAHDCPIPLLTEKGRRIRGRGRLYTRNCKYKSPVVMFRCGLFHKMKAKVFVSLIDYMKKRARVL